MSPEKPRKDSVSGKARWRQLGTLKSQNAALMNAVSADNYVPGFDNLSSMESYAALLSEKALNVCSQSVICGALRLRS